MTEANIQRETPFSQLIAAMRTRGDEYTIDLPADWLQGRTRLTADFRHRFAWKLRYARI